MPPTEVKFMSFFIDHPVFNVHYGGCQSTPPPVDFRQ